MPDPVPPLSFALSADRTRVTVTPRSAAPFAMDAAELDMLIRALVLGRASMNPQRLPDDPAALDDVLSHDRMATRLEPEGDGSGDFLFGLFHPGLGWLGAHLSKTEVRRIVDALAQAGARGGPAPR